MSVALKIELTPAAQKVVSGFQTLPGRLIDAIARGMDHANQYAVRQIKEKHLTGQGPFPPSEHKLGNRSWLLRGSVWASPATPISGMAVQSAIGSNVIYAAIHEFGGRIHHEARPMKLRHRLEAGGQLTRQLGNSNLLMFAKASHKRVRETTVQAKAYDVEMPERAPFRTGLEESRPTYKTVISKAIMQEWDQMKS